MKKMQINGSKVEFTELPAGSIVDWVEVHPLTLVDNNDIVATYEVYTGNNPDEIAGYSVFLHDVAGGIWCVADAQTQASANALYDLLIFTMLNTNQSKAFELAQYHKIKYTVQK